MTDIVQWLKDQGNKLVDVASAPIKSKVAEFSTKATKLEKMYNQWFAARAKFVNAKKAFPYEAQFKKLSDAINKERAARILLLKGFYKVGANPKDYGLQIYGLSKGEILGAYPGLVFNANEARLAAVPLVLIDAAVVLGVVGMIAYISSVIDEASKINILASLQKFYQEQGRTAPEALKQAQADLAASIPNEPGMFDGLTNAAKWGAALVAGITAFTFFK